MRSLMEVLRTVVMVVLAAAVCAREGGAETAAAGAATVYREWPFDSPEAQRRQQETAKALGVAAEKDLDLGGGVTMRLVLIPAGEFLMGAESVYEDESPVHRVRITRPFYMSVTEVTQKQFVAVMGSIWAIFKGDENPAERASWPKASEFCRKLSAQAGVNARLPTEAEWEYVCRAGTDTRYQFGSDPKGLDAYGWAAANSEGKTHPVGQKKPNAWGLYDMYGNLSEWCSDWYAADYYRNSPVDDPLGPTEGKFRVSRGGSWITESEICCSAHRDWILPRVAYDPHFGFRVVVSATRPALSPSADRGAGSTVP
jgi:formylglycine-generating enzyme required for sulfatase activity